MSYRRWRTQEGAAELRREEDRLRGAARALEANLLAWDARACPTDTTGGLGPNGTADPKLRLKRIKQEVVALPKHSVIQQHISTSYCTMLCFAYSPLIGDGHLTRLVTLYQQFPLFIDTRRDVHIP